MKRSIIILIIVLTLTLVLTGCYATDPKKEVISQLKSNPIVSDAVISANDKEVTIEVEITGNDDNMTAISNFRSEAEIIKSKYKDQRVVFWLKRNGEKFGQISY